MASTGLQYESDDDDMDEFMEKFKTMRYKNGFNEETWEEVRSNQLSINYCHSLDSCRRTWYVPSVSTHKQLTALFSLSVINDIFVSQEFDRVPMFMKKAPDEIDPEKYPELACLQAIVHDEDRPPEGRRAEPRSTATSSFLNGSFQMSPQCKQKVWKVREMNISKRRTTRKLSWLTVEL